MRIDVSKEDRNAIDSARDALHRVVLDVLKHHPDPPNKSNSSN